MSKLRIADDMTLPFELAGRRTAIFGISGSGKSNTATVLIEGLLQAGEQVVLIDPKGEGWGLLSFANGKPSNLPIIVFGEPNGHIETLSENHGQRLADFVVETGRSVVLSLLGFESDQSERRFVAAFLRQLYRRKSRQGKPTRTLVVLDEAHLFIPENVRGDGAELAGAVQRIVRQGRSFGIGTLIVDQRPQDVSKRAITQCDTLVCHQLVHKTDRDALRDWVRGYDTDGRGEQFLESLASLQPGEAWVWSPGWLRIFHKVQIHRRKSFDSGAAPDGSSAAIAVKRAEVDLDALRGQLAEIVDKAKADDPKELRKRIADLEKQLKVQPANPTGVRTVEIEKIVEVPVLKNGQLDRTEKILERVEAIGTRALAEVAELRRLIAPAAAPRPAAKAVPLQRPLPVQRQHGPRPVKQAVESTGDLPRGEVAVLRALIQYPSGLQRGQLTVLTGYKRSSRDAYIQRLREKGCVVTNGDRVQATEVGTAILPDAEPLPTGVALQEFWTSRLPEGERKILEVLIGSYPDGVERESLDEVTGYKRSSRDAYLQRLAAKELIDEPARGMVKATDNLFE